MCDINGCGNQSDLPPIIINPKQRRLFLKGMACLPLAAVLAYPELSKAAADKLETVSVTLDDGASVSAALAVPAQDQAPAIILIHEWWGLNDQVKSVAAEFANLGYLALAVDLYDGKVTTEPDVARSLMQSVDQNVATNTLIHWNQWLREHARCSGKLGTVGWCFGGGWSLNASIAAPVDATIVYYGSVTQPADDLKKLSGPVLGHFATEDGWIDRAMVNGFETEMTKAGKGNSLTTYWYEANHAFANPTSARYDAEDAALSWERTTAFFKQHLG